MNTDLPQAASSLPPNSTHAFAAGRIRRGQRWRFVFLFSGGLALYFLLTLGVEVPSRAYAEQHPVIATLVAVNAAAKEHVFVPYQRLIATSASTALNVLGYPTQVKDREIRSAQFSVSINHGCDAIELSLLLAAAILAFPATVRQKIWGVCVGTLIIAGVNLLRVVGLWLIGAHWRAGFDTAHFNLGPLVLIGAAAAFFCWWAISAQASRRIKADGA